MAGGLKSDKDLWLALEGLENDLLDPDMPAEQVASQLRQLGLDPDKLAATGRAVGADLAERERLAWREKAQRRRDELRRSAATAKVPPDMDREAMIARLDELRAVDLEVGTAIRAAARKRRAEESSDEDLRSLLEDMEALRAIEKIDQED